MDLQIKVKGLELTETLHDVVVRCVRGAIEPFGDRVQRVHVRFADLHGRAGAVDTRCRIEADVDPLGTVVVQDTHDTAFQAISTTAEKLTRATLRRLDEFDRLNSAEGTLV